MIIHSFNTLGFMEAEEMSLGIVHGVAEADMTEAT